MSVRRLRSPRLPGLVAGLVPAPVPQHTLPADWRDGPWHPDIPDREGGLDLFSKLLQRLPGRMRSSVTPLGPTVSRDRVITSFPKWYTPAACLQLREHFHGQVSAACQHRNTGTVGFCRNVFDRDYKATIGVDFEMERFEVAGIPFSLQIWDTAGQEKFKCIASAYYRGAQVIITAFDLTDMQTLEHTRQWLEDALRENEPGACFLFLVGTKKDLLSGAACKQAEAEAVRLANEMQAEYWSVSAKTGENVKAFFSRVAALAFERSVLQDLERRSSARPQVGDGDIIRTCRDGGTSTRDPGQQEALQPRLLLAEPASEASTACMRVGGASRDLEGDMEHPPC
ncbi:ras-related protein Rab-36 isoform X2 [Phocoena sinus]|uniref:ras-related protein Rab-36 isoform X2 n=1 Tax=Phocoena sinus TaxID=42100 RepID=UPI0013C46E8B|nr:ras-related protein Rab-36 isoform X2 [Phocoena sinus]